MKVLKAAVCLFMFLGAARGAAMTMTRTEHEQCTKFIAHAAKAELTLRPAILGGVIDHKQVRN